MASRSTASPPTPARGAEGGGNRGEAEDPPTSASRMWHTLSADAVLEQLDADAQGLSGEGAADRLARHGPNRIGEKRRVSVWTVLLHQFKSPLIYVLLGALVVTVATSLITGEGRWADAIVIGIVLVVNGTVGFLQEYRAENAVEKLMQMVAPRATVRRDGREQRIDADKLVPGDIVLLEQGGVVPADVRLMDCQSLQVDEAPLTGESVPVQKSDAALDDADLPPADQTNMAFMSTAVTAGRSAGIVVATARDTQIGRIAQQVEQAGEIQTPLQRRIHQLALWITWGILIIAAIAMVVGLMMGRDVTQMITLAVALAVAAIPAGLPIVVTVALAIGVRRMARQHAVIRHLPAVDTLGSCTAIVSDKTGTLTQNRMSVKVIHAGGHRYEVTGPAHSAEGGCTQEGQIVDPREHRALRDTLLVGVLCNQATLPDEDDGADSDEQEEAAQSERETTQQKDSAKHDGGDPMEVGLLYAGLKSDMRRDELLERYPQIDAVPFETEKMFMATIHEVSPGDAQESSEDSQEGPLVLVKGAPEAVLAMCQTQRDAQGERVQLDAEAIDQQSDALAGEGLRVLAMAIGRGEEAARSVKEEDPPRGLTFVGLQGLLDPPRESAIQAVDDCHDAGIRTIMVTGDYARTAHAIGEQVHINQPARARLAARDGLPVNRSADTPSAQAPDRNNAEAVTGKQLQDFSDEQLDDALQRTNIFARAKPAQKTRLVNRLEHAGEIVAVTGDGVNDAPALKSAHIGAAMGSGTDVAREASDMVITDDNFASVYAAVRQGRTAFRNIRMATFFLLSTGAADVLIILSSLALGWRLPLLPAHILWCNVVTNGIADVALAFEPGEKALYRRPPRPPREGILDRNLIERLVVVGLWLAVGVLGVFLWKWGVNFNSWNPFNWDGSDEKLAVARTAALTTLVLFQKVHVFNCRSEDVSIFRKSLLSNKLLFIGVLTSLAVHIAAIYTPILQDLLTLAPLDAATWLIATLVALTAIAVNELHKWLRPRHAQDVAGRSHGNA